MLNGIPCNQWLDSITNLELKDMKETFLIIMIAFVALFFLLLSVMFVRPWLRSVLFGAPVPFAEVMGMWLRHHPPMLLIDAYISLRQAEISTTISEVEKVYFDNKNRITSSQDLVELAKQRADAS